MTPATTWTAIALIGIILTLWNLRDGWWGWRQARRFSVNGERLIATQMFLVMYLAHFIGYAIWLAIGVIGLVMHLASGWSPITVGLVAAEATFVVKSILLRIFRYRLNRYAEAH